MRNAKLSQLPLLTRFYLAVLPALCVLYACVLSIWLPTSPKQKSLATHLRILQQTTMSRYQNTADQCSVTPIRTFYQDNALENENVSYFLIEYVLENDTIYKIIMQYENEYYQLSAFSFKNNNPFKAAKIPVHNRYIAPIKSGLCIYGTKIGDSYYNIETGEILAQEIVNDWAESAAMMLSLLPDRVGTDHYSSVKYY